MLQIFAIDRDGERFEITDLYWFEEQGVHDFGGEGSCGEKYRFEVFVHGVMVFQSAPTVDELRQAELDELLRSAWKWNFWLANSKGA